MLGVEVLNDDEGHAGWRKGAEKLNQRFQASGGGAYSDNEDGRVATGVSHSLSISPLK